MAATGSHTHNHLYPVRTVLRPPLIALLTPPSLHSLFYAPSLTDSLAHASQH